MKLILEGETLADIIAEARRLVVLGEGLDRVTSQPVRATQPPDGGPLQHALEEMPPEPVWDGVETLEQAAIRVLEAQTVDPDQRPVEAKEAPRPHCNIHQKEMVFRPAGVTKSGPNQGKPRGAFWSCGEKMPDGSWCKQRRDAAA